LLTSNGNLDSASNPGELFRLLTNNLEFRVAFGDHVHKLMFNGGPLYTLPNTIACWTPTNQFRESASDALIANALMKFGIPSFASRAMG
jgi:hypothetical protein